MMTNRFISVLRRWDGCGCKWGKSMSDKIYVIYGIDMETDVGSFTPFYDGAKNGTPKLIDLFNKKGVEATFYFTGECAKENPEIVDLVKKSGNEIGCHSLYHETVGDELFPIPGEKPLLTREVAHRLETATEWVKQASGIQPVSFRCPRLWGSTEVVNTLEKLGYKTDASYPMYFYRERFSPYHPSKNDWTKEGKLKILEIPNFADMTMESKDPGLERDRDQWPLFRTKGAKYLMGRIERYLEFLKENNLPAVLCFYFHPWEFVKCKRAYRFGEAKVIPQRFITKNCGKRALKELALLTDMLKDVGAVFISAENYARRLDKK